VNPWAQQVSLPREAHKIRRLNDLFQSFIRMVTLVHQYQRRTDDKGRLLATAADIRMATEILFDRIVLKVDELDGSLRGFFEQLKAYVQKAGGNREHEFCLRELRQHLHISKTQLFRYISDLVSLEYVRQSGGHANRGYMYRVVYWDDYEALRARIRGDLEAQLDNLECQRNTTGTPAPA
jgi:DNA primase